MSLCHVISVFCHFLSTESNACLFLCIGKPYKSKDMWHWYSWCDTWWHFDSSVSGDMSYHPENEEWYGVIDWNCYHHITLIAQRYLKCKKCMMHEMQYSLKTTQPFSPSWMKADSVITGIIRDLSSVSVHILCFHLSIF